MSGDGGDGGDDAVGRPHRGPGAEVPVVGDVVQVLGWIGVLVEVDASGERGTIRWDRTGGPLGSAVTRGMPLVDCRVRADLRAVEGRDVWTRR